MTEFTLASAGREPEPIRAGFGRGLVAAGRADERVVALCADLTESTQMHLFQAEFPDRFVQVGVAEQNLATVAAGMAHAGHIPFASSYAAFSPGRNWEQIKTTACLNDQPVKIVGSHTGLNVGPDGATHQMLEDIALMRVLPNMVVISPADSAEAEAATVAMAKDDRPSYLRLARGATPAVFDHYGDFRIGEALRLRDGTDIGIISTGTMTAHALEAARILFEQGVSAAVLHVPTIKPLDVDAVVELAGETTALVTVEEAQIAGGLGGLVAETVTTASPVRVLRLGVHDRYGESGDPTELLTEFGLDGDGIATSISHWWSKTQTGD